MTIGEFFGTLQESITAEWRKHLQTGKYSKHMALDEFYKEMPEKVDALIEAWQADNDVVEDYKNVLDDDMDALEYMEALKKHTKEGRKLLKSSELESLADDILSLIDSTIYKLKHLKESMPDLVTFLKESLNEGVLDANLDIKESDLLTSMVQEFCEHVKPAGGCRHGNIGDTEWYDGWAEKFRQAVCSTGKKMSTAKVKTNWDAMSFIVIKAPQYSQFVHGHYQFNIYTAGEVPGPRPMKGAIIGVCPSFDFDHDVKSALSARGCAWVEAYPIPTELANELCNMCRSNLP